MKYINWCKNYPWLGNVGGILIFLSWIYQNQLLSNATEERIKLENTQTAIDLQEVRMEMWHKAYVDEKTKQNPDTQILLNTTFKTLQSYLNILAWSSVRIKDNEFDKRNAIEEKYLAQETLTKWYQNKDLKALETDLGTVIKRENETRFQKQLTEEYGKRLVKIDEKEKRYTRLFIFLYVFGSMLIGLEFMLKLNKDKK